VPTDIRQRVLCLAIDEEDNTASFELAMATFPRFGSTKDQARGIRRLGFDLAARAKLHRFNVQPDRAYCFRLRA
jgi:hypothetical protein